MQSSIIQALTYVPGPLIPKRIQVAKSSILLFSRDLSQATKAFLILYWK